MDSSDRVRSRASILFGPQPNPMRTKTKSFLTNSESRQVRRPIPGLSEPRPSPLALTLWEANTNRSQSHTRSQSRDTPKHNLDRSLWLFHSIRYLFCN